MSSNPKFTINNFRIFDKPQTFELAPITILTGPNNSGKSSMVKSLLLMKNEQKHSEIPYVISLPNSSIQLPRGENLLNSKKKLFQFQFDNTFLDHKFYITVSYKLENENSSNESKFQDDLFFDNLEIKVENNVVLKINSVSSYYEVWNVPFIFDFKFWYEKFKSYRVKRIGEYETKKGITFITKETKEFNDLIFSERFKGNSKIIDEIRKEKLKQEQLPYQDKNLPIEIKERFNKIQKDLFFQFNSLFVPNEKYISEYLEYSISAKYTYLECIKKRTSFFKFSF
jgi:AAA15 family ATPase/GTPase